MLIEEDGVNFAEDKEVVVGECGGALALWYDGISPSWTCASVIAAAKRLLVDRW